MSMVKSILIISAYEEFWIHKEKKKKLLKLIVETIFN